MESNLGHKFPPVPIYLFFVSVCCLYDRFCYIITIITIIVRSVLFILIIIFVSEVNKKGALI